MEGLVLSVSHQCSSLQSVAALLLLLLVLACVLVSLCQCVLSLCDGHCTGSQRSQFSGGTTCRIALGYLALNFVSPGLCLEKKAVAVVESTKGDSISCVLMRGQLFLVPSGALP